MPEAAGFFLFEAQVVGRRGRQVSFCLHLLLLPLLVDAVPHSGTVLNPLKRVQHLIPWSHHIWISALNSFGLQHESKSAMISWIPVIKSSLLIQFFWHEHTHHTAEYLCSRPTGTIPLTQPRSSSDRKCRSSKNEKHTSQSVVAELTCSRKSSYWRSGNIQHWQAQVCAPPTLYLCDRRAPQRSIHTAEHFHTDTHSQGAPSCGSSNNSTQLSPSPSTTSSHVFLQWLVISCLYYKPL